MFKRTKRAFIYSIMANDFYVLIGQQFFKMNVMPFYSIIKIFIKHMQFASCACQTADMPNEVVSLLSGCERNTKISINIFIMDIDVWNIRFFCCQDNTMNRIYGRIFQFFSVPEAIIASRAPSRRLSGSCV